MAAIIDHLLDFREVLDSEDVAGTGGDDLLHQRREIFGRDMDKRPRCKNKLARWRHIRQRLAMNFLEACCPALPARLHIQVATEEPGFMRTRLPHRAPIPSTNA